MPRISSSTLLAVAALAIPAGAGASFDPLAVKIGPGLRIDVVNGFPQPEGPSGDVATFAMEVKSARPLDIALRLDGPCQFEQKLAVPGGEKRRYFFYLPRLSGSDWSQGGEVRLLGLPEPIVPISQIAESSSDLVVGQLGRIDAPVQVHDKRTLAGDVSEVLPDHWRGLSGFAALVVERSTLESNPTWLPLLRDWVLMGGVLLVPALPGKTPIRDPIFRDMPLLSRRNPETVHVGLGAITYVRPNELAKIDDGLFARRGLDAGQAALREAMRDRFSRLADRERSLVNGVARPPCGSLFLLLALFAVLVGPVAWLFWVHKKARPFVYLGTTILLAILFGGALMATDLVDKGVLPIVKASSISLRDERRGAQIDYEEAVVFAPMQRGTELRVPADAVLFVHTEASIRSHRVFQSLTIGPSVQTVEGAVPVRSGSFVHTRRLSKPQGQLVVGSDAQGVFAENHLPYALRELYVWHGGTIYTFGSLDKGARRAGKVVDGKIPLEVKEGTEMEPARKLMLGLMNGELGADRYVGRYRSADLGKTFFSSGMREVEQGEHFVAGTY